MKFVFDLDGTICFKGQPISEKLLVALENVTAQGHDIIFASARPIRDLLPVLHERFHNYPMIGGNGSIVATQGKTVSIVHFDPTTITRIKTLLETYNITYLIDSDWDYAYTGASTHSILNNLDPQKRANHVELEDLESIIKILILTSSDMKKVEEHLKQLDVVVHSHSEENILDISPLGIDKWSGLQQLNIKENEYIAFGNDANDITMFQHALHSVMIGENGLLSPFSSERLPLHEDIENDIIRKLEELVHIN